MNNSRVPTVARCHEHCAPKNDASTSNLNWSNKRAIGARRPLRDSRRRGGNGEEYDHQTADRCHGDTLRMNVLAV